jgi:hypothetical protein
MAIKAVIFGSWQFLILDTTVLQRLPVDLNQDGFRGPGKALWR